VVVAGARLRRGAVELLPEVELLVGQGSQDVAPVALQDAAEDMAVVDRDLVLQAEVVVAWIEVAETVPAEGGEAEGDLGDFQFKLDAEDPGPLVEGSG